MTNTETKTSNTTQRGSALVFALVMVAILTVIGMTLLKSGGTDYRGVLAKRRADKAISCADAAREYLLGLFASSTNQLQVLTMNTIVDDQRMTTGHYDAVAVASVSSATGTAGGSSGDFGATDISNRIVKTGLGGQVYRFTVVCSSAVSGIDAATHQSEVEVLVKFGY